MLQASRKFFVRPTFQRSFSSFSQKASEPNSSKVSLRFSLGDSPGALQSALNTFAQHNVNLSRLESKPCQTSSNFLFDVAFPGDSESQQVKNLLADLRRQAQDVNVTEGANVPWFPHSKKDLDIIANEILDAGAELEADHPGFHDAVYRKRRDERTQIARNYSYGEQIPRIDYSPEEIECWRTIYSQLRPLHEEHACAEHLRLLPLLEHNCGYGPDRVPQLQDISDFLTSCTGFAVRPVAGLLSTRNFLYGLAFRTFFSTQYLRHHSRPLYTPEPDIVHELMGHVPLFADQDFADFSQQIGLAAIGASDEQIEQLGRCYWFTVEFGLCKQNGELKAYGAGLLSSPGELRYSMLLDDKKPELLPFDPFVTAKQDYPITTYQPKYFVADSFKDAKDRMIEFTTSLSKPFNVRYNLFTHSIEVDGNVKCRDHIFVKPTGNPYA